MAHRDDDVTGKPASAMDGVIGRLVASLPELSEATCSRIHATLEAYVDVDETRLAAAVERNMRTSIQALRTGVVPAPEALTDAAQTARERYESGLRVEEIVRGFRISIAMIHELFVDTAVSSGLPVGQVVDGSRIMWAVGDSFTTRIITEYHALELGSALLEAQRGVARMRALLSGAPGFGPPLDAGHRWAAVHCDLRGVSGAGAVRARLQASGSTPQHAAVVVLDGDHCLGVVARRPSTTGPAVGLGPFVAPADLPRSDAVARECLALARHLGRDGVQSTDELGWRLAAAGRMDVWVHYHARFVAPMQEHGEFGVAVLKAVGHWLATDRSVTRTATALSLHPNTVRYRIARFEELTGAHLDDPDDQLGVRWAIELGSPAPIQP